MSEREGMVVELEDRQDSKETGLSMLLLGDVDGHRSPCTSSPRCHILFVPTGTKEIEDL